METTELYLRRLEKLEAIGHGFPGVEKCYAIQAGRELLLAESSDWAFILSMGTSTGYAEQRTNAHLGRFDALADGLERGRVDPDELRRAEAASPFLPELDPRIWVSEDAWPEPLPPGPGRSWFNIE